MVFINQSQAERSFNAVLEEEDAFLGRLVMVRQRHDVGEGSIMSYENDDYDAGESKIISLAPFLGFGVLLGCLSPNFDP